MKPAPAIAWLQEPGFTTSSSPDYPGGVRVEFFLDSTQATAATVILGPEKAKELAEAILDSRSKYLKDGAKTQ